MPKYYMGMANTKGRMWGSFSSTSQAHVLLPAQPTPPPLHTSPKARCTSSFPHCTGDPQLLDDLSEAGWGWGMEKASAFLLTWDQCGWCSPFPLLPTLWQMLWDSQEAKINMGRGGWWKETVLHSMASFSILTNTWSLLPPGLLLCGDKLTSYSLVLTQKLTITCSHYQCTWYKIPPLAAAPSNTPGNYKLSFPTSPSLKMNAFSPPLPTWCIIHSCF